MLVVKFCKRCGEERPVSEFYRNRARSDGLSGQCVEHQKAADRESYMALRLKAMQVLGGCCEGCGFEDPRALQFDHRFGGGSAERRALRSERALLRKVIDDPRPYALLCANCNVIKRIEQHEHKGNRVYVRDVPLGRWENG